MKKNHFVISYAGNKRGEVEKIYEVIDENVDLDKITTIVEPFCGTSAVSYYLSTLHPKKFKYVLNDINQHIVHLYNIMKDDEAFEKLAEEMDELMKTMDKVKYKEFIKNGTFEGWLLSSYVYTIRPGCYPLPDMNKKKFINMLKSPIVQFMKTENVTIRNDDGLKVLDEYKNNKKAIIFLDPPYLESCNQTYLNPSCKIYEYLYRQNILKLKSNIFLGLEKMWIIEILFEKCKKVEYDKLYQMSKKKTVHQIILNKRA